MSAFPVSEAAALANSLPSSFFFLGGSHPHRGMKLSTTPTSSNRFGNSQMPGGMTIMVKMNKIKRTMARTKKRPRRERTKTETYQTPSRNIGGQSGKSTP